MFYNILKNNSTDEGISLNKSIFQKPFNKGGIPEEATPYLSKQISKLESRTVQKIKWNYIGVNVRTTAHLSQEQTEGI